MRISDRQAQLAAADRGAGDVRSGAHGAHRDLEQIGVVVIGGRAAQEHVEQRLKQQPFLACLAQLGQTLGRAHLLWIDGHRAVEQLQAALCIVETVEGQDARLGQQAPLLHRVLRLLRSLQGEFGCALELALAAA